jgi:hypothetical protein
MFVAQGRGIGISLPSLIRHPKVNIGRRKLGGENRVVIGLLTLLIGCNCLNRQQITETEFERRSEMIPVPELNDVDLAFGNIKHMPKYDSVPEEFHRMNNPYVRFVSEWFALGRTKDDMDRLIAKEGVDKVKALRAIKAILGSWEPKHEHKEAGCAYLLSQWFDLKDAKEKAA